MKPATCWRTSARLPVSLLLLLVPAILLSNPTNCDQQLQQQQQQQQLQAEAVSASTTAASNNSAPLAGVIRSQPDENSQELEKREAATRLPPLEVKALSSSSLDAASSLSLGSMEAAVSGEGSMNMAELEPAADLQTATGVDSSSSLAPTEEAASVSSADLDAASTSPPASTASTLTSRQGRASGSGPSPNRLSAYSPALLQVNTRPSTTLTTTTTTTAKPAPETPFDPIIVCYLGSWSVYRPSVAKFTPENINPYLCTHIIYAFAGLSSKFELKPFDSYSDITLGGYHKFTSLKEHNKQLKTLIAVGGWNEGSTRFSKLVASPELRANFIQSTVRFLREHKFDGLDLDWEYPGYRDGSSPDDRHNYAALIKELRAAFDKDKEQHPRVEKLLLSVAVPAGQDNIDNGFDVPTISKNVDFMNVLTYDYYTAFDRQTNHHAPLTIRDGQVVDASSKRLNIEWTIDYYLSLGAAPNKLVLGVPTYGRSYTLTRALSAPEDLSPAVRGDEDQTELLEKYGLGANADSPGDEGSATREKGYLAYYEICQKLDKEDWYKKRVAPTHQGPLAFRGNQWVSYDDVDSAILKTQYVIRRRLGGVMVWTLDNDDFRGSCPSSGGQENPLITAIRDTMIRGVTKESPSSQRPTKLATTSTTTTTTSTTTTTTTTTTTPPPPTEPITEETNELAAASDQNASSSLIKNLASGARQAPTTPDPGPAFSCKDEGFFPNPKDCKKYFWCLDSGPANLGVVAHAFTCPSGLFFNSQTEGCDYPEKVACKQQRHSTTSTTTTTTTTPPPPQTASRTTSTRSPHSSPNAERNSRPILKKTRKQSTTTTTSTTTTPAPTTSTTTTTTQAPQTTTVESTELPNTNDINELVASMLQNPAFARVINNQLKMNQQSSVGSNGSRRPAVAVESIAASQNEPLDATEVGPTESSVSSSSGTGDAGGPITDLSQLNSKQAQDLLQLLNLLQSLGKGDSNKQQDHRRLNERLPGHRLLRNDSSTNSILEPENLFIQDSSGTVVRQRRPQTQFLNEAGLNGVDASPASGEPLVFNYAQPDQRDSNPSRQTGELSDSTDATLRGLSPEIMSNLAQLESLFAYNQPGRQAGAANQVGENQFANPPTGIESQHFTVEDAKIEPMLPLRPSTSNNAPGRQFSRVQTNNRQEQSVPLIRVQVPEQRGRLSQQQPQQRPAASQQRAQQQQTTASRSQNYFNDVNSFLPYLEGDVRQSVPRQSQQRAGGSRANVQHLAAGSSTSRQHSQDAAVFQPELRQPEVSTNRFNGEPEEANRPAVTTSRRQPQGSIATRLQLQQLQQQPNQQRRRPPNRDRNQRLNQADFPIEERRPEKPKSLVLLTAGPPIGAAGATGELVEPTATGNNGFLQPATSDSLTDQALEERLRLLESGLFPPSEISGAPSPVITATPDQPPSTSTLTSRFAGSSDTTTTEQSLPEPANLDQLEGSKNSALASFEASIGQLAPVAGALTRDISAVSSSGRATGEDNLEDETPSAPVQQAPRQTEAAFSVPVNSISSASIISDAATRPGASIDPETGKLVCNRRGVFAHPNNCGQFIVCAPQSRTQRTLRPFEHHCPAEHIFHDSWGRCRPKSLQSDFGKFCQLS